MFGSRTVTNKHSQICVFCNSPTKRRTPRFSLSSPSQPNVPVWPSYLVEHPTSAGQPSRVDRAPSARGPASSSSSTGPIPPAPWSYLALVEASRSRTSNSSRAPVKMVAARWDEIGGFECSYSFGFVRNLAMDQQQRRQRPAVVPHALSASAPAPCAIAIEEEEEDRADADRFLRAVEDLPPDDVVADLHAVASRMAAALAAGRRGGLSRRVCTGPASPAVGDEQGRTPEAVGKARAAASARVLRRRPCDALAVEVGGRCACRRCSPEQSAGCSLLAVPAAAASQAAPWAHHYRCQRCDAPWDQGTTTALLDWDIGHRCGIN